MSRNIVEFGYGSYSTSFCRDDDKLLAAEPLLGAYPEVEKPEGLSFFQLDNIAIAGYDGVCDICFNSHELGLACTPLGVSEWGSDENNKRLTVECLMLDSWLARYSEHGFTERIDIMNCVLNGNADPIFENFSFEPSPEFIMIRQSGYPDIALDRMQAHGYRCFACGGAIMGG